METLVDTEGTAIEQWIRDISPSLAFYSNSNGRGFIGKKALKSVLTARALEEFGNSYSAANFNEAWELLLKQGFIQQLVEKGKPKGVAGATTVPSPVPAKATLAYSEQLTSSSADTIPPVPAASVTVNGSDVPAATDTNRHPKVAALSKTAPLRFNSATKTSKGNPAQALVTPGGSLTAQTARELAAFGGAVIRRGASAQVNIAIPQNRARGPPSSHEPSSSSASSVSHFHVSEPSTPSLTETSPDPSTHDQLHSTSSQQSPIPPPEPAQPWKSLEVSLVDASLMRGFSPASGLAVPEPTALPQPAPTNSTVITPNPGLRSRAATLPVPPPQPMVYSLSSHLQQLQQPINEQMRHLNSQLHQHSETPLSESVSQASTAAFSSRPRPPQPPAMSIPQSQPIPAPGYRHPAPRGHDLSRTNSAMSPNVIYNPPLRLSEISLPYKVQYHILTLLLSTLEFVFFDFSSKWFPEILNNNFWDCPEAAEVTNWSSAILQALNSASGEVQVATSESARTKINRKPPPHALAHLTKLLQNVSELHQDVARRVFISGERLLGHLDNTIRISSWLGCNSRASDLEEVTYYVKEALGGIGIVRETVRGNFNEKMEGINKKREELLKLEQEVIRETNKLEREQCTKLGMDLMATLEPKLAKMALATTPLERPRRNSWKEPAILKHEPNNHGPGIGPFFPPMNSLQTDNNPAETKGKGKAVDTTPTPTTPIDRGRGREPRISISSSKITTPISTTPKNDEIPPAIPAKAARRLSNLYPPTYHTLDYDTDIEHEREGPGGVGLELTLSQSGFPQTAASSSTRSRVLRKEQGQHNRNRYSMDSSDARPVTPAQLNMLREPVPQATSVPISKLIEEDDSILIPGGMGITMRRNESSKSIFLHLHSEISGVVERGKSVPAPATRTEKVHTPASEKRHSAIVGGGTTGSAAVAAAGALNTGPTPPLTPKERKVASAHSGQDDPELRDFFARDGIAA